MPTAAVTTLGCKVNQAEGEALTAALAGAGFAPVSFSEVADLYVVNSCTVTSEADHKSRKLARAALRTNPNALVVLAGCYATVEGSHPRAPLPEEVLLVSSADKDTLAGDIAARFGVEAKPASAASETRGGTSRTRAMIKAQDGCDNGCAYCVVPLARGAPRGMPADALVTHAERLVDAGTKEIVLTGINLGRYDAEGANLAGLVRRILSTGIARVRLSSIEPQDFSEELIDLIGSEERICPHAHVPLQSGSDDVLRRMNRRYQAASYVALASRLRAARPDLAITTDVMVGFPGETDADAKDTIALLEDLSPAKTHVFKYSARPGTTAAEMPAQVDPDVKRSRAEEVAALDRDLGAKFARALVGRHLEVLVEQVRDGRADGLAPNYVRCFFKGDRAKKGTIVGITAVRATGRALEGEVDGGS